MSSWILEIVQTVLEREKIRFKSIEFGQRETVFTYQSGKLGIHKHATRERFEGALQRKNSVPSRLAQNVEEFVEYCIEHEINHYKQETISKIIFTPFSSYERTLATAWNKDWENCVSKLDRNRDWHPSEYVKRHVKLWHYSREWFAESYLLYRHAPGEIQNPDILELLKRFEKLEARFNFS
jgi:hypothetical protein